MDQNEVTIGELARVMARVEEKLDEALKEQGRLRVEIAVIKTKVGIVSSAVAGAAVLAIEAGKALLFGK